MTYLFPQYYSQPFLDLVMMRVCDDDLTFYRVDKRVSQPIKNLPIFIRILYWVGKMRMNKWFLFIVSSYVSENVLISIVEINFVGV